MSAHASARGEDIVLNPCQSLALRRLIEAFKVNDGLYTSCPDVVRDAFADFYMPPYSNAEMQIKALEDHRDELFRLIDKLASKIHDLEARRSRKNLPPLPY